MTLYVNKNNQKLGPFTLAQAQRMVATGTLLPTDWAWYDGLPDWLPLRDVPGFSERQAPEPPPADQHDRPVLVWIISLLYFFSFPLWILGLLILPLFSAGAIPLKDMQQSDFHPTNGLEYAIAWLNCLVTMAWAIQFFRLKWSAFPLYLIGLVVSILTTGYSIAFEDWLGAVAHGGLTVVIGAAIGWLLNFALLGYTWHLLRKGVLH